MGNQNPVYAHLLPTRYRPGENGSRYGPQGGLVKIAQYLRKHTKDGKDVCEFLLGVMRDATERTQIRVQAAEMIFAYSFGKPRETIELLDERLVGVDRRALVAQLSSEERAILERLVDLALTRQAQRLPNPVIDTDSQSVPSSAQDDGPDADPH